MDMSSQFLEFDGSGELLSTDTLGIDGSPIRPVAKANKYGMPAGVHVIHHHYDNKPDVFYVYAERKKGAPRILKHEGNDPPKLSEGHLGLIKAHQDAQNSKFTSIKAGSLSYLAGHWCNDADWRDMAESTKKTWGSALRTILRKFGKRPLLAFFDPRMALEIYRWSLSRKSTPRAADLGVQVLKRLLAFGGMHIGSLLNVAAGLPKLYRPNTRPEIIWTDADVTKFIETAEREGKPELARVMKLAQMTGLRRADLISLTRHHIFEQHIFKQLRKITRRKKRHTSLPTFPALIALLRELKACYRKRGVNTILVNKSGSPWTENYLTREFKKIRDLAGIVHVERDHKNKKNTINKSLHDVRGTFATKLIIEAQFTDPEVAEVMGWSMVKVESIRRAYVSQSSFAQAMGAKVHKNVAAP